MLCEQKIKNKGKNVTVAVLQGFTRAGKTTFCEQYAKKNNMSIAMSSGSNDFMQDYKGEDCFCLDDATPENIKLKDLVKFIDPHKVSSTISRYHNKVFLGDIIFICTNLSITDWYSLETYSSEDMASLYSRIDYVLDFVGSSKNEPGVSYYTINKIKYIRDKVGQPDLFEFANDVETYEFESNAELVPINDEKYKFELHKYIDITADENKRNKFLDSLDNM